MKHPSHRRGFTLIELLVVALISTLLVSLLISFSSTSRQQITLAVEQAKLTQVIAKAKALAISTYVEPPGARPCGYGVHIDAAGNRYELFRYAQPVCAGITSIDTTNPSRYSVLPPVFVLDPSVRVETSGANRIVDVFFTPPVPGTTVWVANGSIVATGTVGTVQLATQDGTLSRAISVNAAGQITF